MADIQELMNKMENLNKEIITVFNETKQEIEDDETEKGLTGLGGAGEAGSNCPRFTREVKLCCTTVVNHFNVETSGDGKTLEGVKLIYDPSCLHAVVEEETVHVCNGNCTLPCYVVKIIGSLPFAFSATNALNGVNPHWYGGDPDPTCPLLTNVDLCCQCCVCVDNSICCYPTRDEADTARQAIAGLLLGSPCDNVSITDPASAIILKCRELGSYYHGGCKDETYVKFEATLTLIPVVLDSTDCATLAEPVVEPTGVTKPC